MTIRAPLPTGATPIVTWGDMVRDAALSLTDCPEVVIRNALQRMAIERYQQHRAWRAVGASFGNTVASQAAYTLTLVDGPRIVGLPSITVGLVEAREQPPGRTAGHDSSTILATITGNNEVTLNPAPTSAGQAIVADLALAPTGSSTGLPDWLAAEHREAIAASAVAFLAAQLGKPWANPGIVQVQADRAERLWARAANLAGRVTRAPLRVRVADAYDGLRRVE